jgi:hypothetical protein
MGWLAEPYGMGTIHPWPTHAEQVQSPLQPTLAGPCGTGSSTEGAGATEIFGWFQQDSKEWLKAKVWLDELLTGHSKWFYRSMGMNKHVFKQLLWELIQTGLHDTRYVTAEEQLAIFLYLAVMGLAHEEHFQRSPNTISKWVCGSVTEDVSLNCV